jgi:hypothetical protein
MMIGRRLFAAVYRPREEKAMWYGIATFMLMVILAVLSG